MATTFLKVKNRSLSSLASDITDSDLSLTVVAGGGALFPSTYPFHITIEDEILECTNRSTNTLTVTRAAEGTAAAAHVTGKTVSLRITAQLVSDLNTAVNTLENDTEKTANKDAASGYAGLNASLKVIKDPASLTNIVFCNAYDHPDDAITAIGANNKTLLVTETEICDTNFTVPSNVKVRFERGGKWTINTGITVTFNGQMDAGLWQIFEYVGTGTLAGNINVVGFYPQWWGATGDGSTDDTTAIQNTISAVPTDLGKIVFVVPGIYKITASIVINKRIRVLGTLGFAGGGISPSTILKSGDFIGITISTLGVIIDGIRVKGDTGNGGDGIQVRESRVTLQNVISDYHGGVGIRIGDDSENVDTNLWKLINVTARNNSSHGIFIDEIPPSDANAGSAWAINCSCNGGDGLRVGRALVNTFSGGDNASNTGAGIRTTSGAECNTFLNIHAEGNTAGQFLLDHGSKSNLVIGSMNYTPIDKGTNLIIQSEHPDKLKINHLTLDELGLGIKDNITASFGFQYPPEQSDAYVKATTKRTVAYWSYFATDPTKSLTGTDAYNSWVSAANTEQRFHIDLGNAKVIKRIYYENNVDNGFETDRGVRNFTFWGSNTAASFAELTYGTDTGWTQLATSQNTFDQHIAADQADPKYILVTNTTPYRYYAFKFADCYGDPDRMGLRRVVLQIGGDITGQKIIVNTYIEHSVVTIADGDTTPDVSGGEMFITSANTNATAITDLDNPTVGQTITLIGGSDTNASTIADGGNFKLNAAMTLGLDDSITLFVKADNNYIELSRSIN